MKRRNLWMAGLLIGAQVALAFWQMMPAGAVTETKGSKRVVLDIDAYTDERLTELALVPGAKINLYFYLRDNGTTINVTRFLGGTVYNSGYEVIFKGANGYTLTTKTLSVATPYSATSGGMYCTLGATDVTSLTKFCAVRCTTGTIRVLTEYIKITPDSVSRP